MNKRILFILLLFCFLITGCFKNSDIDKVRDDKSLLSLSDKVICVDAGHGINNSGEYEPIAPGSSKTKPSFVSGTSGKNQTEEELNLKVALKLEKALIEKGAKVYMTRTTHETEMSNIDRALLANDVNADISVKLHADGIENSSVSGVSMLVPGNDYINDSALCEKSRRAGELIFRNVLNSTGANDRGVVTRNDLTGFNWTKVPIVLLEMGFMTNPEDDKKLESDEYQQKIVDGIVLGLIEYFEMN